jgi:ABC-type dipeptide/oligopeptide/nickel transport system permease subunit
MIEQSSSQWRYHPNLILVPSAVLALVLIGTSFLGDSLNDALDPKRKRR